MFTQAAKQLLFFKNCGNVSYCRFQRVSLYRSATNAKNDDSTFNTAKREGFWKNEAINDDRTNVHSINNSKSQSLNRSNDSKNNEVYVSDWIRNLKKHEDRSYVSYRRYDYDDPIQRTIGIVKEDLQFMFFKLKIIFQECKKCIKKEPPYDDPSKVTSEMIENEFIKKHAEYFKERELKIRARHKISNEICKNDELTQDAKYHVSEKAPSLDVDRELLQSNLTELLSDSKNKPKLVQDSKKQWFVNSALSTISRRVEAQTSAIDKTWPSRCDILIIGGGAIGSSIAYHLKSEGSDSFEIVLVEKDLTYKTCSAVLSVGGIRQQFSLPENILLSQYGAKFLRKLPQLLEIDGSPPPCVNFQPHGYLTLASEESVQELKTNYHIQKHFNAKVAYLEPSELKDRFSFLNVEGIAGGVLGLENEGWFDPWSLLIGLKRKAIYYGVDYVEGEVVGLHKIALRTATGEPGLQRVQTVEVKLPSGDVKSITPSLVILAAGHNIGSICYNLLDIGKAESGIMAYPVPIEPRKRYVYTFHAPIGPGLNTPMVIDSSGAYFRREGFGNMYIAGMSPAKHEEPSCDDLSLDHDYFTEKVWPTLAHRVPNFNQLKIQGGWAGFYEYNVFDQNGIVGYHPYVHNLLIAGGFSGHGIQHCLGVGRAVSELLLSSESKFCTLDLSRFSFDRILMNEPIYETNIF